MPEPTSSTPASGDDPWLNVPQVSDELKIHPATVRAWVKSGRLAAVRVGRTWRVRRSELERGITLAGPHRDDLILTLNDLPARGYASHGEGWSAALALRLACYDLLSADGAQPVLILDDVFAELDTSRRDQLAAIASSAEQVLISSAVVSLFRVTTRSVTEPVGTGARTEMPSTLPFR